MEEQNSNLLKTGTTTVGILCADGLILGADKRATAGNMIVDNKAQKIHEIGDEMAVTTAGLVSDAQLLTKYIKAELKLKEIRTGQKPSMKEAGNLLAGMVYQNIRKMSMIPGIAHFLMGGKDDTGYYIYDIFPDGSITAVDKFISSGSGSVFAYGVLETMYKKDIKMDEGVKLVIRSINAALQRDSASGGGIDILTIGPDGMKHVLSEELTYKVKEER
jgi:proteasome beta subunit